MAGHELYARERHERGSALDAQRYRAVAALWQVNPVTGAVVSGVYVNGGHGIGSPWQATSYAHVSATSGEVLWTRSDTGQAALWTINPGTGEVVSGVYLGHGERDRSAVAGHQLHARERHGRVRALDAQRYRAGGLVESRSRHRRSHQRGLSGSASGIGSPWQATSYAHTSDTSGEVLWTRSDTGQAALWTINPGTGAVLSGVYLGPASGIGAPWQATSYLAGAKYRHGLAGRGPC